MKPAAPIREQVFQGEVTRIINVRVSQIMEEIVLKLAAQIQQHIFQGEVKQIIEAHVPQIMETIVVKHAARIMGQRIIADTRPEAKEAGRSEARDQIGLFLVETVRETLHIALTRSPGGAALRVRRRMLPAPSILSLCHSPSYVESAFWKYILPFPCRMSLYLRRVVTHNHNDIEANSKQNKNKNRTKQRKGRRQ